MRQRRIPEVCGWRRGFDSPRSLFQILVLQVLGAKRECRSELTQSTAPGTGNTSPKALEGGAETVGSTFL